MKICTGGWKSRFDIANMIRKEYHYLSKDGVTVIHAVSWAPEGKVKAVLQITHGMIEHIGRYDRFAAWLTDRGYFVIGQDLLGHGQSVRSDYWLGYFAQPNGNECLIRDMHQLRMNVQKRYPDVPYFMLGHSMGSFLLRQYLTEYPAFPEAGPLSGALILDTGYQSRPGLRFGMRALAVAAFFAGWDYKSQMILNAFLGNFDLRYLREGHTLREWLTSDHDEMMEIYTDPLCNFLFTLNGYYQMLKGMETLTHKERLAAMDKNLPVLFASGTGDPVGNFGRGVRKVYQQFLDAGMRDVDLKLYAGDRHEILHEKNKDQVYEDLYNWMEDVVRGKA